MANQACNIFFQEDVEDYIDDPMTLLDFEVSENCLRNVTIEDPGYIVRISSEDYEIRLRKSLSQLKELKKPSQSSGYANNYDYLLSKCLACSIKLVDCNKYPWYYQNRLGSKNKTQNSNTEHNIIDVKEEYNEKEITIKDLIENEHFECNKQCDNTIREKEKTKIVKVRKQTPTRFFKPVLNIQNKSHSEVPRSEAKQDPDLIFRTYTRLIDTAVNKLKSNIESEYNTSQNRNLGNQLVLGSKSFEKIKKVPRDINNNESKKAHHKKNNSKHCFKIKIMYKSEQISKTKLKITKSLSKEMISSKNYRKDMEDKEYNPNQNAKNREQYGSLKTIDKQHNSFTNENKQERIQSISYSYPLPSCSVFETFASLPNQTIGPDRIRECNKQLFSGERIIPHYHKNTGSKLLNILSKTKSNTKCPKCSNESTHNFDTKIHKNDLIDDLKAPLVSQIPNPSMHQTIHAIGTNNAKVNINKPVQKNYNTKEILSNFPASQSVNPSQVTYKPVNNDMILHRSQVTPSPDAIIENVNKSVFMSQSKTNIVQLEEERQRYLLPSNYK